MKNFSPRKTQPWMLALALLASAPALHAATTDIYSSPPQATASGVKPNIMFLLDDSGSMTWDHLPDSVGYGGSLGGGSTGYTTGMCRLGTSSGSSGNSLSDNPSKPAFTTDCAGSGITITIETMKESGVPYFSKDFNGIFYNPTITYLPPVDYDGTNTTYKSYTNVAAPYMWATVKPDPFPDGNSLPPVNVQTAFPEQIFCDGSQSGPPATFDAVHCRRNVMTNATFSISSLTRSGTTVTATMPNNHFCQPLDKVTIVNATGTGFNGTFTVNSVTPTTFTYTSGTSGSATAGGTPAASACNIPITKLSQAPSGIGPGFAVVTAVYPIPHGCVNGETVNFRHLGTTSSLYDANASVSVVDERTLNYTTAAGAPPVESAGGTAPFVAKSSLCAGTTSNYSTSTTVPPLMQGFPQGIFKIHKPLNSNPHYFTIGANEYCTDDNLTQCAAPVNEIANELVGGVPTPLPHPVPALVRYCGEKAGNAAAVLDLNANPAANIPSSLAANAEKGCHRVYGLHSGLSYVWPSMARYGYFTRVDIVTPTTTTYPKAASRTDCSGAVGPTGCSYNEEMTNFSNWYAYYRTRIQMVKSAASLAFKNLSPNYRVGFNSLNAAGSARWLPVAPFDLAVDGQKQTWYTKLNAIVANGGTPSRAGIARIGRYYGGMKSTAAGYIADDPIEASCQQNFVFFATDGFWTNNGGAASAGIKLDGTVVGDQDGVAGTPRPLLDSLASASDDGRGTLADTAYYYYITDLRDATHHPTNSAVVDVTQNNVPFSTADPAKWQHMTTFTMGLGLDSTLIYKPGYTTPGNDPDYDALVNGTPCATSITPGVSPCIWPAPFGGAVSAVDDLWHAAVNGHGLYFSAKNPSAVVSGLASSFAIINQRSGVVAAPATSNPNATPGDNFVFDTTFTTLDWYSELVRFQINPLTGAVTTTPDWTAQAQLDGKTTANSDTRTIYTFDSTNAATHLRSFVWASLTFTEQGYFNGGSGGRGLLGQWSVLSPAQQNSCDGGGTLCGEKLVNFLRGQRGFETTSSSANNTLAPDPGVNSLFRHRVHIFGDTVNASAVYVKKPPFGYLDQGYSAFKAAQATRQGIVYVAANDGMLHAFNSDTGAESWAYIPTMVMPNMWHLADFDYANNHMYFVDGTPASGDICTSNCTTTSATWKTILVGGLNAGGRGFYALDITDPANPKALWELKVRPGITCIPTLNSVPQDPVAANTFDDCDIGLSFGNPVITKRADGKWVVLVTSGYNNVSPGSGGGFLYVVDAVTGAILNKIATLIPNTPPATTPLLINAGNTTTPSGFTRINAFVTNSSTDNTALRVYGGDLNNNLWRIDSSSSPNTLQSSGNRALLLAIFGTANAANTQGSGDQPITTAPALGEIPSGMAGTVEMVYVGTGRFLGSSDVSNTSQQSFYAIKDPLGNTFTGWGVVRTNTNLKQQTLTVNANGVDRTTTANTVTITPGASGTIGWFIDFNPGGDTPGERSNTDPIILFGTVLFTTNAPNSNTCDFGGTGVIYFLNLTNGGPSPDIGIGISGTKYNSLVSGLGAVTYGSGSKGQGLFNRADNGGGSGSGGGLTATPQLSGAVPAGGKRINWRELNF